MFGTKDEIHSCLTILMMSEFHGSEGEVSAQAEFVKDIADAYGGNSYSCIFMVSYHLDGSNPVF